MIVILAVLFAFLIPALFFVFKEFRRSKSGAKKTVAAAKPSVPLSLGVTIKAAAVVFIIISPAFFLSGQTFSFYPTGTASLKIAFKKAGKRVVDCDEAGEIKRAGERYRAALREHGKGVQMNLKTLGICPRQRHPLKVVVKIDGKEALNKTYPPTGISKDMASYVFEDLHISPGVREIEAYLHESGGYYTLRESGAPDFSLKKTATVGQSEIKLIRFDEFANALVLE